MENRMNKLLKLRTMTALGLAISTSTCYVNAMKPEHGPEIQHTDNRQSSYVEDTIRVLGAPLTPEEQGFISKHLSAAEIKALDEYESSLSQNPQSQMAYNAILRIVLIGIGEVPAGYKPGINSATHPCSVVAYSGLVFPEECKRAIGNLFLASNVRATLEQYNLVLPEEAKNQLIKVLCGREAFPPEYLPAAYGGFVQDTLTNNSTDQEAAKKAANEILSMIPYDPIKTFDHL